MRVLFLFLAWLIPAAAFADIIDQAAEVQSRPMTFELPEGAALAFRGAIAVTPPFPEFGGISGIEFTSADEVIAVTDSGQFISFRLLIENGRLTGVADVKTQFLKGKNGTPLPYNMRDAEDIARDGVTGALWVSFEGIQRVWKYDSPDGTPQDELISGQWAALSSNGGIEALAYDSIGQIWVLAEGPDEDGHDMWVHRNGVWQNLDYPQKPPFRPTAADFDPFGRLYVAERAFSILGGFRFRLRRFVWGGGLHPISDEEIALLTAESNIDNIEALSILYDAGKTWILIASDDNYMPFQRNVIALFELTEHERAEPKKAVSQSE